MNSDEPVYTVRETAGEGAWLNTARTVQHGRDAVVENSRCSRSTGLTDNVAVVLVRRLRAAEKARGAPHARSSVLRANSSCLCGFFSCGHAGIDKKKVC